MTNTALLRNTIYDSGLKLSYIAKKMGLSAYGLQKKINGESEFKASEIAGLCDILKIDDARRRDAIFFAKLGD